MRSLKTRARREATKGIVTVWRPWQLKSFKIFQSVAVSIPSCRLLAPEYLLAYAQSGTADIQYRNTRISNQVVHERFLMIEPGETWTRRLKDVTYYCLTIDPAWLEQFAAELFHREQSLPHFPSQSFVDPSLSRALQNLITQSHSPASRLQQEEMQLHLLVSLLLSHAEDAGAFPRLRREHSAVKRTKDYLQAHYAREVSLHELAEVVNMSPFHLAHVFRQEVGLPPHAYQTQLRLARARTLLAQGYDVRYVASETGFFDQSHFAQQFKRYNLMTPGTYRNTARFS